MDIDKYFELIDLKQSNESLFRDLDAFWAEWISSKDREMEVYWVEPAARLLAGISMKLSRTGPVTKRRMKEAFDNIKGTSEFLVSLEEPGPSIGDVAGSVFDGLAKMERRKLSSILALCKLSLTA